MRSVDFRREREASWKALEGLLDRTDRVGLRGLPPGELERLPALYRGALSALAVARAISLDRALLEYLEGLAGRAYFRVYARKDSLLTVVVEFLARGLPRAARRFSRHLALSAALLVLGVVTGYGLVGADMERFDSLVAESYADGRNPAASTEDLRKPLYDSGGMLTTFAMFLFGHNARIGLTAAALGVVAGLPTAFLLFQNGVLLGAFVALYDSRGLGLEFWAWILPHGVTELLAVVVCGAAGLAIGEGLLFPGRATRLRSAAERGRAVAPLILGAVLMFFAAGLVEGIFRQTVQDVTIRLVVATTSAAFWAIYLGAGGRGGKATS